MISIIIASVNERQLQEVKINIDETIGVPFEIIAIENSDGKKGLCEIYNQCAKRAKFDMLCFMHEDVNIKTSNWGKVVVDSFLKNRKLGLLGVKGSKYKAISPSGWGCYGISAERGVILQGTKEKNLGSVRLESNPNNVSTENVVCVDGVWFCTTKNIALNLEFDETTFTGFHCYDIDYSLKVYQEYDVAVTFGVMLEHFSTGNFDGIWMREVLKLQKKWMSTLPGNADFFNAKQVKFVEKRTFKHFATKAKELNLSLTSLFSTLWKVRYIKVVGVGNFLKLNLFLLGKLFG